MRGNSKETPFPSSILGLHGLNNWPPSILVNSKDCCVLFWAATPPAPPCLGFLKERWNDQCAYGVLGKKVKEVFCFHSRAESFPVFMENQHLCVCFRVFINLMSKNVRTANKAEGQLLSAQHRSQRLGGMGVVPPPASVSEQTLGE